MRLYCRWRPGIASCKPPSGDCSLWDNHKGPHWSPNETPEQALARFQEYFWKFVEKGKGCWTWNGGRLGNGYGQIYYKGRKYRAHRLAKEWAIGAPFLDGMYACHRCDNKICVRPDHIFVGTSADNHRDLSAKGLSGNMKLNRDLVAELRARAAKGEGTVHLAAVYGVSRSQIRRIVTGVKWAHSPMEVERDDTNSDELPS